MPPLRCILNPLFRIRRRRWRRAITRASSARCRRSFDAGPVNGDWNERTQAALAQFQLSVPMPAGGQLDEPTLAELGVGGGGQQDAL